MAETELDDFLGVPPPSRRNQLLKYGAIALGIVLLLWLLSKCVFGSSDAVSYATRPVERGDLTVTVSATGNLLPTNQVEVGSEISGLVTNVLVDDNDRVSKGQLLARIDTSRLQDAINQTRAQLQAAQASVAQAQAGVSLANANLNRQLQVYKLSGGKVPSGAELDAARAQAAQAVATLNAAQAQVAQQRAALSSAQTQFGKASILSPVNGVVLLRQIEPGQTVAASLNAPTLFVIAEDLSQMKLEAKVDEADVGQVQAGQAARFTVDAFPGRSFPAQIVRVNVGSTATATAASSSASSSSNTVVAYTAVLSVTNPDLILRPGMTATADIVTTEKRDVLLVPNASLRFSPERAARQAKSAGGGGITSTLMPQRRGGRSGSGGASGGGRDVAIGRGSRQTVYVVGANGEPKAIRVVVGDSDGSSTEVTGSDLKVGMRVITGQLAAGQTDDQADAGGSRKQGSRSEGDPKEEERKPRASESPTAATVPAASTPTATPVRADRNAAPAPRQQDNGTAAAAPRADRQTAGDAGGGDRFRDMTPEQREEFRKRREERMAKMTPAERAEWEARRERRRAEREGGE